MRTTNARRPGWAAIALGLALAAAGPAAAGPGPSLTFRERFGDVVIQRQVTQRGQFRIDATLPLNGVDIGTFNGSTTVHVSLGNFGDSNTLGQDPRYRPGRRRATIVDGAIRVLLRWNRSRVRIRVIAPTGTFPPLELPLQAGGFLDQPSGPISGATLAFIAFDDASQRFDVAYTGQRSLRNGRRSVTLNGAGAPPP